MRDFENWLEGSLAGGNEPEDASAPTVRSIALKDPTAARWITIPLVYAGKMALADAQRCIASNWIGCWEKHVGSWVWALVGRS